MSEIDSEREWYIYVLKDPRTDEVRYVGWTVDVEHRYGCHLSPGPRDRNTYKARWVANLMSQNVKPTIEVIDSGVGEWQSVERYWILHYRMQGAQLTNTTDGGQGALGYKPTPETIEKLRAVATGRKATNETRRKMSESRRGKKRSSEFIIKMIGINKGRKHTAEARANMGNRGRGFPGAGQKLGPVARSVSIQRAEDGKVYKSIRDAAKDIGIAHTSILRVIRKGRGVSGGYHWRYVDENDEENHS